MTEKKNKHLTPEEVIEQNVEQSQNDLEQASRMMREAFEMMEQVPIWENYDLSQLDEKAKEAIQKQTEQLRAMAKEKFTFAQEEISRINQMISQPKNEILRSEKENTEKTPAEVRSFLSLSGKFREIAQDVHNAISETFNRFKDAVQLTGQKLDTIKKDSKEWYAAVTNNSKVKAALKAQEKIFTMDMKMLEAKKEQCIEQMKTNEVEVMKLNNKAEILYERAMRQNERAYSVALLKAGMTGVAKNMFGHKKDTILPNLADFSVPKDPLASQIASLQEKAREIVMENRSIENDMRGIEKEIVQKSMDRGQFEPTEDIDRSAYAKATMAVRKALEEEVLQKKVLGQIDFENADKLLEAINREGTKKGYAFNVDQLRQISLGMEKGLDMQRFIDNPQIPAAKISIVRGLEEHGLAFDESVAVGQLSINALRKEADKVLMASIEDNDFAKNLTHGEVDIQMLMRSCYESMQQTNGENEPSRADEIIQAFRDGAKEVEEIADDAREAAMDEASLDAEEIDQEYDEDPGVPDKDVDDGMDI